MNNTQPRITIDHSANTAATASAQAIAKASEIHVVTDARGREIGLKKPAVLAQFRLVEVLGESAANDVYMGMVLPLVFVVSIDDQAEPFPASKLQLEALISRLDEDGIAAVHAGVHAHFGKVNPDADKAALKN